MIFLSSCFVLFHLSYAQANNEEGKDFAEAKRDAQLKFADILQQVINLNELRFNAMKELTRLQERTVSVNYLRARNDIKLDMGHMRSPVFIILGERTSGNLLSKLGKIFSKDSEQRVKQGSSSEKSIESSEDETTNGLSKFKRCTRRSEIFCVKEASKICRRSCIGVYRDTCLQYRCTRRFKKEARRNCKRTCKREFRDRGKYDDSSDTD